MKAHSPQYLLLLPCLLVSLFVKSQQYNFKVLSVEQGLAQSQVYALCEDSRGYLWMGTRGGGLSRYDGINFRSYSTRDGLSDNYIFCIREAPDHKLWIGTNRGLSCFNGRKFENFFPGTDSSAIFRVQDVSLDQQGLLWLATNHGIYTFDPKSKSFRAFSAEHQFLDENIYRIYLDGQGGVWAGGGPGGLGYCSLINGSFQGRIFAKGSGIGKNVVQTIAADSRGTLWVGTYGMGCFVFDGHDQFKRPFKNTVLDKKIILDIKADSKGDLWIATLTDGVVRYNSSDSSLTFLRESEGLSNNHVRCILEDSRGNYWFGTSGGGVCKYYGELFTHFNKDNGLSANFIYSVFRDSRKNLWLGSGDKGLCQYDGSQFIPFGDEEGFRNVKVRAIAETPDSTVWFGTDGSGVYQYRKGDFKLIHELKGKYIRAILRDKQQNMWVATAGAGIYKLTQAENGKFEVQNFNKGTNSPLNRINCLAEDPSGRIWFGCESGGAGYIENGEVKRIYTRKDSLPSDGITSMTIDKSGYLWIGTAADGLCLARNYGKDFRFEPINTQKGLTSGNIYLICTDELNNLFVGSESGLDKLILDNERHLLEVKHYGKAEGFTAIETCRNAVYEDEKGVIWFGTINGLTKYNPHNKPKNALPPNVHITGLSLFYEPLEKTAYSKYIGEWSEIRETMILPHTQNLISFDFCGINLGSPENVQFRWRLNGFEKSWSPPGRRSNTTYSNLPPGDYTFEVIACNEDGVWNEKPAQVHFIILRPFWMEPWFMALCVVAALSVLFILFRWRVRLLKKKSEQEKNKLETEKQMLELEQKALRLQMNPHFIFNALNSIQDQISENNEQTARYYLAKFSRLMRMILENSRSATISLEDEVKTLENYLSLEKFSSGDQFDYSVSLSDTLDPREDHLPPMMIQPFVENAIIHGLKHLDRRGRIDVRFEREGDLLVCRITDNGIGRARAAELNKAQQEAHHKSTALIVTQERLDLLQKEKNIRSLEIIDLKDDQGNACGTEVVLRVPLVQD